MNRDKQIALMRIAADRCGSPLSTWIRRPEVRDFLRVKPSEHVRNHVAVDECQLESEMHLACA